MKTKEMKTYGTGLLILLLLVLQQYYQLLMIQVTMLYFVMQIFVVKVQYLKTLATLMQ